MKNHSFIAFVALILIALFSLQTSILTQAQSSATPDIIISEFLASNDGMLYDEDGDDPDWIELHNISNSTIDLGGYYLTDDADDLTKWQFPTATPVSADDFLVIFASDKDRAVPGEELHTNFKLSASGEFLALVKPDGTTVEWQYAPEYPQQFTNVSYGVDEAFGERYFTTPTPGNTNATASQNLGPEIVDVNHAIQAGNMVVTAQITSTEPISNVTMTVRRMFNPEVTLPMVDDGSKPDLVADDGIYSASIPPGYDWNGEMVRYFISAENADGVISRAPIAANTENAPHYFGYVNPDPSIQGNLEVLHWFVEDVSSAETRNGTRASIEYRGIFYDNIFVRTRGGVTSTGPKPSFKFDMNNGYWFEYKSDVAPMEEIDINSTIKDATAMRPILGFQAYADAGAFASLASAVRVERNGEYYSVANFIEHPDERYLERQGLDPNGALYQFNNGMNALDNNVEKKTRKNESFDDVSALIDALQLDNTARETYLLDNVDIPNLINYMAVRTSIHDWDVICHNYYIHRDTEGDLLWRVLPWDKDLALDPWGGVGQQLSDTEHPLFGGERYPVYYNTSSSGCWNRLLNAVYESPMLRELYLRRLRSVMDQLLQPPGTPYSSRYLERNIDAQVALLRPDIYLDNDKWGTVAFDAQINNRLKPFVESLRVELYQTHAVNNGGLIPNSQLANATVEIDLVRELPQSGDFDEQFVRLYNPGAYAVDISGWTLSAETDYTFDSGVVIPAGGVLYVARNINAFQAREYSPTGGQRLLIVDGLDQLPLTEQALILRNDSGTLVDQTTFGFAESPLANEIVISEILYKPLDQGSIDGGEYEFIELTNITTKSITITGIQFVQGIEATVPAYVLDGEASVVLARNATEFAARYPAVTPITIYDGKLSNSGEGLALLDADDNLILAFEYDDKSPWPEEPDDDGSSLELMTHTKPPSWGCNWRASAAINGTPGSHVFSTVTNCMRIYLPIVIR